MMINVTGGGKVAFGEVSRGVTTRVHRSWPSIIGLKFSVCSCISYRGVGLLAFVEGTLIIMNSQRYTETLEQPLRPSVLKLFGSDQSILQEGNLCISSKVRPIR